MNDMSEQECHMTYLKLRYGDFNQKNVFDRSNTLLRILGKDYYNYQNWFIENCCDTASEKTRMVPWYVVCVESSLNTVAEYLARKESQPKPVTNIQE